MGLYHAIIMPLAMVVSGAHTHAFIHTSTHTGIATVGPTGLTISLCGHIKILISLSRDSTPTVVFTYLTNLCIYKI